MSAVTSPPLLDADRPRVEIPAWVLDAVLADLRCDLDRARTEHAIAAPPGSSEAQLGDALEETWRAMRPGASALLDWAGTR
ncbi:MAG TPA: hypothetical protein VLL08_23020 [Kineosporiaceae bacterium]|nr:hypothetical protein [Kineosporiaceae bacterium]